MFSYSKEIPFKLVDQKIVFTWLSDVILREQRQVGDVHYIFCDDEFLYKINHKYLKHNTLTDIITFNYNNKSTISGDIFISVERVEENASKYHVSFLDELHRVMVHGVLHLCGYNDKTKEEQLLMRKKEDYYLSLRTF